MNYILLKKGDETKKVKMELTMTDLKILHNACVDVVRELPEMISYKIVMTELEQIIKQNQ